MTRGSSTRGALALAGEPNPVWVREMRQAARLGRTPILLATLTALMTLLVSAVGGAASASEPPAEVGVALFHTFFSLAYAVVTWVGPGVAAMIVASERSGHTWEPLVLTGLSPRRIAIGKFLAALSYLALYVVMLAPVGALPFLFGGVTASEVAAAFALLLLIAVIFVGFGLSIGASISSPGMAVVVALPVAVAVSIGSYLTLGVGLAFLAHEIWPAVAQGAPIWLPTAYVRAEVDLAYLVYLVLIPIAAVGLCAWFFFEATIANMSSPSDDRSTGLSRWLLVALPTVVGLTLAAAALLDDGRAEATAAGMAVVAALSVAALGVFAGEPLEASSRVRAELERRGAGAVSRFLGPGIVNSAVLVVMVSLGSLGVLVAGGSALELLTSPLDPRERVGILLVLGLYAAAFLAFLAGLMVWARARASSGTGPRLLMLLALFVALAGPWLVMAILGIFTSSPGDALLIAAPSPAFAFAMIDALDKSPPLGADVLAAGGACMAGWSLLGLGLLLAGARRAARVCEARHVARARLTRSLDDGSKRTAAEPQRAGADAEDPEP